MRNLQRSGQHTNCRVGANGQHVFGGDKTVVADQRVRVFDVQLINAHVAACGPDYTIGKRIVHFADIAIFIRCVGDHKQGILVVNDADIIVRGSNRTDLHIAGSVRFTAFVINNRTFDILIEEMGDRVNTLPVVEHLIGDRK